MLSSPGPSHPNGLGNNRQQVGRNLLFSAGGIGQGTFYYHKLTAEQSAALQVRGPFVNRGLQDWYTINDKTLGHIKGGTIDFLFRHPNAIARAIGVRMRHEVGIDRIMWGGDFPHVESEWPNSKKVLAERFKGVPQEEQHKMVAGNAIEFFHLNGA